MLYAPIFMAVEPRIRAGMLIGGGLIPMPLHPAMHPAHFAPRTRTPTLMINGENDFLQPYEASQGPVGTPATRQVGALQAGDAP